MKKRIYTEADLISFGNHLLSPERLNTVDKVGHLTKVVDTDLEKWKSRQRAFKWFWAEPTRKGFLSCTNDYHARHAFGFGWDGKWNDNLSTSLQDETLGATPAEMLELLTKEATSRGFKKGSTFICLNTRQGILLEGSTFIFCEESNTLRSSSDSDNQIIFQDGTWAKVII